MRTQVVVVCLSASALVACRPAAPAQRQEQQLKDSFAQQVASTPIVRDFQRSGDTLSFSARYGKQAGAKWRVHIDSATIQRRADGTTKDKRVVKSSWYVNGEPIQPRESQSDLPLPFLDSGIAQECRALWDSSAGQWSWK